MRALTRRVLPYALVLVLALGGGMLAMGSLERSVSVLPGESGCRKLANVGERTDCYAKVLSRRIERDLGAKHGDARAEAATRVLSSIDDAAAGDPTLQGVCHQAMHVPGRAEGRRLAERKETPVFPEGAHRLCTAGFVHGVSEGYLEHATDPDLATIFPQLCHEADAAPGCAHGIGHALLRARDDAGSTAVSESVDACRNLPAKHLVDCANGVYMELALKRDVNVEQVASACAAQNGQLRGACMFYLPLSAAVNDVPSKHVPRLCADHGGDAAGSCVEAWGRELGLKRITECRTVQGIGEVGELADRCLRGALELPLHSRHASPGEARIACGTTGGLTDRCRELAKQIAAADPTDMPVRE